MMMQQEEGDQRKKVTASKLSLAVSLQKMNLDINNDINDSPDPVAEGVEKAQVTVEEVAAWGTCFPLMLLFIFTNNVFLIKSFMKKASYNSTFDMLLKAIFSCVSGLVLFVAILLGHIPLCPHFIQTLHHY